MGAFLGTDRQTQALLDSLESSYLRIDQNDINKLSSSLGQPVPTQSSYEMSEADKQKLTDLLKRTEFFKVSERLGSKDLQIAGRATGYKVVLQAEGLKELMRGLRDIEPFKGFYATQDQAKFESDMANIKQSDLDKVPFEVWLRDGRLAQLVLDVKEADMSARFELSFSRYGEDVQVQEPANSRPISELLEELLGGALLNTSKSNLQLTTPTNLQ